MKLACALLVLLLPLTASAFDHSHAKWSEVLKKYQDSSGLMKYKQLKADSKKSQDHSLHLYLKAIQGVPLTEYNSWSDNQKKAFLINAYNALTVKLIIDNYPVKSIKKIGGWFTKPWSIEFFSLLSGQIKSLDPIEHEWLRPNFKDYKIHAAVNCASISCPPLRSEAFVADQLDQQLDDQMKLWLNDKSRNEVNLSKKIFKLSKIFDWYKEDFEKWGGGVKTVVNKYLKSPLSQKDLNKFEVEYLDYDWNLNESK